MRPNSVVFMAWQSHTPAPLTRTLSFQKAVFSAIRTLARPSDCSLFQKQVQFAVGTLSVLSRGFLFLGTRFRLLSFEPVIAEIAVLAGPQMGRLTISH